LDRASVYLTARGLSSEEGRDRESVSVLLGQQPIRDHTAKSHYILIMLSLKIHKLNSF
jgi:hypothetical protein